MISLENLRRAPLEHLDYFVHWGGKTWQKYVMIGIRDYLGDDLNGKRILEIGPGIGRMSCLFALLGGQVTAIDVKTADWEIGKADIANLGLGPKITFVHYDGDLNVLAGRAFDIIFTKSVLIYQSNLADYLSKLESLLSTNGQIVFIENAQGGALMYLLRRLRGRKTSFFERVNYFAEAEVTLLNSIFEIELCRHSSFPPIYLFRGKKKGRINRP